MKVVYIGYYNEGSTARMRGEYLKELLHAACFNVVNIDVPFFKTKKIARTIGWRFKAGPLINNINDYIIDVLRGDFQYDLVWIDKGVFIDPEIIRRFRERSKILVHFTPDPAFSYHQSKLFYKALPLYDYCITTKSFELERYQKYGVKTIFCTQGYDPRLHKPYHTFEEKNGVVFIGHKEDEREEVLSKLVEANIPVVLAGIKWQHFARRYKGKNNLLYKGTGIFGDDYAKTISSAQLGLGLLSKWIPEKHTTRTFEIPACATALITEENTDTTKFFNNEEAIFFSDHQQLTDVVKYYISHPVLIQGVTKNGFQRVTSGGFDYKNILKNVMTQVVT
jgi:spore maturation protein CgeB